MAKKRTIYVRPGDLIDFRVVAHDDFDTNASGWSMQMHPESFLLRVNGGRSISAADFAVRLDPWPRERDQ